MSIDHFAHKAGSYEQNRSRVDNVDNIASSILNAIRFDRAMHVMDFGSGTGLLLERIAPHVGKITAVDVSRSMNGQLRAKAGRLGCTLEIVETDLEESDLDARFDGIVSSMTMHHIADVTAMFRKFHSLLKDGGFIAISDLDAEDGSFHGEDTGVHHFGFDREWFAESAAAAGFRAVRVVPASVVHKPQGDFPVFLLTAVR
ncbi:MAG: class I SAM-dependent methyltransferase [Rhodocyclales bacterium]|nr:class I SAM-dependent methyltransferase [Rhodocyclales bacterium]